MNFVIILLCYDKIQTITLSSPITWFIHLSPFHAIFEGMILSIIIEIFATKICGNTQEILSLESLKEISIQ